MDGALLRTGGRRSTPATTGEVVEAFCDPEGAFSRFCNFAPFSFSHRLAECDLFTLENLVDLSLRLPDDPEFAYWSNGCIAVTERWEKGRAARLSLAQTIEGIADNNSLVILKHTEQDRLFGPLLRDALARLVDLCGPSLRRDAVLGEAQILISSPHRVTSYHIDAECNFLAQVSGGKTVSVFDPTDRTLLTDPELERFHAGDSNGAVYREERQRDAAVFHLRAGEGVHIPPTAPHWGCNGDTVSIALSIKFELRSIATEAMQYRFNRLLRRAGLSPRRPRAVGLRHAAASRLVETRLRQRMSAPKAYRAWTPPPA